MEFDLQQIIEQYGPWVVSGVLKVVGALILLLIGLRIAGMLADFVRKESTKRENVDSTLGNFFASIVRWGLTAAVAIAVLSVFGVQVASFAAILPGDAP